MHGTSSPVTWAIPPDTSHETKGICCGGETMQGFWQVPKQEFWCRPPRFWSMAMPTCRREPCTFRKHLLECCWALMESEHLTTGQVIMSVKLSIMNWAISDLSKLPALECGVSSSLLKWKWYIQNWIWAGPADTQKLPKQMDPHFSYYCHTNASSLIHESPFDQVIEKEKPECDWKLISLICRYKRKMDGYFTADLLRGRVVFLMGTV